MLTTNIEKTGGVTVVRCSGRLVRGEAVYAIENAVMSQKDLRIAVLDLSEVETMDAGGLTALVFLHHWTLSRGIQLKLVDPSPFVLDLMVRTRLDRVFDISSFDDAILVLSGYECPHSHHNRQARHALAW